MAFIKFLSTPSVRRATRIHKKALDICAFLSTPSVRRATFLALALGQILTISIHALREEGDKWGQGGRCSLPISIHALREEGDRRMTSWGGVLKISIHALREEGDNKSGFCQVRKTEFLSTPSVRRATSPPRWR